MTCGHRSNRMFRKVFNILQLDMNFNPHICCYPLWIDDIAPPFWTNHLLTLLSARSRHLPMNLESQTTAPGDRYRWPYLQKLSSLVWEKSQARSPENMFKEKRREVWDLVSSTVMLDTYCREPKEQIYFVHVQNLQKRSQRKSSPFSSTFVAFVAILSHNLYGNVLLLVFGS